MNEIKFLDPLIRSFEKLPGVGQKTATRYAFQVVEKLSEEDVEEFARILLETKQNVKHCSICNILTTTDICDICDNELREKDKILVVKDGNIVEKGKHEDLLKQKGFYSELYYSQFK